MTRGLVLLLCVSGLVSGLAARWVVTELLGGEETAQPVIFAPESGPRTSSPRAELATCRAKATGDGLPSDVRRRIRRICGDAAGKGIEDARGATLAACLLAAREVEELEGCGLDRIGP